MKKILITGSRNISSAIATQHQTDYVMCASKSNGYNINNIFVWGSEFLDFDIVYNCAYDNQGQLKVLEFFATNWKDDASKIIVNIGSKITDYARSELSKDRDFFLYRYNKLILQKAFSDLTHSCKCDLKLFNPGPVDLTDMAKHLDVPKLEINELAKNIKQLSENPLIKRVDLWL